MRRTATIPRSRDGPDLAENRDRRRQDIQQWNEYRDAACTQRQIVRKIGPQLDLFLHCIRPRHLVEDVLDIIGDGEGSVEEHRTWQQVAAHLERRLKFD